MRALAGLLFLACAASAGEVLVRVTFQDDPIEGAGVGVVAKDEAIVFEPLAWKPAARTDEAGEAVVDVPDEGRVVVAMAGYALAVAPVERETVDVKLRPERIFTGSAFDSDGKPVAGARVTLRTTFNVEAVFPARTDAEGRFAMLGLWLDDYALAIEAVGFLAYESDDLTEKDSGAQHVLSRPASLSGRAVDGDGEPVADLAVAGWGKVVRTDAEGRFVFEGIAPGEPDSPHARPPYRGRALEVVLHDGETRTDVTMPVQRPARLRWRTVDAAGKPVETIEIAYEGGHGEPGTDEEGRRILPVRAGEPGALVLDAEGFQERRVPVEATGPGGVRDLGDVVLARTAMVEVGVLLPGGTTAPEGKVGNQPLKEGAATVPQGKYTVTVPGYVEVEVDVQPPGPVLVTMPQPHWLTGIVLSPEGAPIADVAVLASQAGVETKTDAEGRFRLGPLPDAPVALNVGEWPWKEIWMEVAPGEGEVLLRLEEERARLLRGRVFAGEEPVRRFSVNMREFVDEQGRFELVVQPDYPIRIDVGRRTFLFPFPPPDEELVARLPEGRARVTLEGGAPGREVRLLTVAGRQQATETTDVDGIAAFDRLQPGLYVASADGYRAAEVNVDGGEPPLVSLHPEPTGVLRVKQADGTEEIATPNPPGQTAHVLGVPFVFARVQPGQEIVVDLAPKDAGSLVVRGAAGPFALEGRIGRAWVLYSAQERLDPVPPGRYQLRAGLVRREVVIAPGANVVIDLEPGAHTVTGRVLLPDGTPAHGASVGLMHEEEVLPATTVPVDPRGVFRFPGVHEGVYRCYALGRDSESNVARIVVGPEEVSADGLPLVIRPSSDARARLLLPGGTPLEYAHVRIDGRLAQTDGFGRVELPGPVATLDLDLPGVGSVRGRRIRDGQTVELARGAGLVVLFGGLARERIEVRVGGRPWAPLEPDPVPRPEVPGQLRLDDLPAGVVEVEILPDPRAAPVPEQEAESPPPEPEITRVRLRPGMVTTVDVSG